VIGTLRGIPFTLILLIPAGKVTNYDFSVSVTPSVHVSVAFPSGRDY
jgi:hypothetical protein